ncbi:MAG: DNA helicase II [Gammaproteobacteria bacterium]|nr:DNA helicase II [Gammaproteobacteria bacterium]
MDVSDIIEDLNDAQRDAVCTPSQNTLVLAGAGSGKTRVLVHRIAWMIQTEGASPHNILAVTFTNKAAGEMRSRIEQLLQMPVGGMWVGTFHSLAHRLLRLHWQDAGLPQNFQILDSDDQYRAIRRVLKNLELDEARWPPKQAQWFINARKDEGQRPEHINSYGDPYQQQMLRIYQAYEEFCQRTGVVDFAELLFRAHELWLKQPRLLDHYRQRFKHILVDEFQDTNAIQYAWIRLLAGKDTRVFAVGDDDQSIYGWRGARIENIQQYSKDFPNTYVVRLEQNYRSTGNILKAANALIANNFERLGKNLWTSGADGDPIHVYRAFNEQDEARFIVDKIQDWADRGGSFDECAVLYRSNAQSRVLEEALIQANIPYRVYGGLRFFERAEIKDALAYVRLVAHQHDDAGFERVVNTPARGIGEKTLSLIRSYARDHHISLFQASQQITGQNALSSRAANAVKTFIELINSMVRDTKDMALHEIVEHAIHASTLYDYYDRDKTEIGRARIENLQELISAAQYFQQNEGDELDELSAFLAHAALEAGEGQTKDWQNSAQLMTMHSAKGLEFPLVFMCGMEEGLFPNERSVEEPGRLEEERRLCYVGITRARQQLYLSHAQSRRLYGSENYPSPSRFIREIPRDLLDEVRIQGSVSLPAGRAANTAGGTAEFYLGQRVSHAKFGEGVVLNYEGQGPNARIQINFNNAGSKWLVVGYANLQSA